MRFRCIARSLFKSDRFAASRSPFRFVKSKARIKATDSLQIRFYIAQMELSFFWMLAWAHMNHSGKPAICSFNKSLPLEIEQILSLKSELAWPIHRVPARSIYQAGHLRLNTAVDV